MSWQQQDAEIARLRAQLEEKERQLQVVTLQAELAQKQEMVDSLTATNRSAFGLMPTSPPSVEDLDPQEAQLVGLIQYLRSAVQDEVEDALFTLSEMVTWSYGADGARLGEIMRTHSGLSQLTWILADPRQPLEVHQQTLLLLGNLCSDSVDAASMLSKRFLLMSGVERIIFNFLRSEDEYTLMFACGCVQNLCHDTDWSARALAHQVDAQLSRVRVRRAGRASRTPRAGAPPPSTHTLSPSLSRCARACACARVRTRRGVLSPPRHPRRARSCCTTRTRR